MKRLAALLALALVALLIPGVWDASPAFRAPGAAAQTPTTPGNFAARGLATDPAHPGTVYVGLQTPTGGNSGGQGIWKSTDYGTTWARVDQPWAATCGSFDGIPMTITVDPTGIVYAVNVYGCDMGVLRSIDGGVHWTNLYEGDFNNVAVDPSNQNHLLAAYHSRHDICGPECDTGVVESFNAGSSWQASAPIPTGGWGQYVHFITPTTWFVSTQNHGAFRTTNSGATWTKVLNASAVGYGDLLRVGSAIYAGLDDGIYRSTNGGATWANVLPETTPDVYMGLAANSQGRIYAHSAYPFIGYAKDPITGADLPFKTSTDGLTWTDMISEIVTNGVVTYGPVPVANGPDMLATDDRYVYSANWQLGVWRECWNLPICGTPVQTATPTPTVPTTSTFVVPTATPTPMAATSTPTIPVGTTPTSTSTPTAAACQIAVRVSGALLFVDQPAAFCAGAHP